MYRPIIRTKIGSVHRALLDPVAPAGVVREPPCFMPRYTAFPISGYDPGKTLQLW